MSRSSFTKHSRAFTQAHISSPLVSLELAAFVDSGADENFMDQGLARQLQLQLKPLPSPLVAHALDGSSARCLSGLLLSLSSCQVTGIQRLFPSTLLTLLIFLSFFVFPGSRHTTHI